MKRITIFSMLMALLIAGVIAQRPEGVIMKTAEPPVIDGLIDDVIWNIANVYNIDRPHGTELPTIGLPGEATWRALWDDLGMYIFLVINDDSWWPSYLSGTPGHMADRAELYFDVNYLLGDGLGAGGGQGHYMVGPTPTEAIIGGTPVTLTNGVVYSYRVINPNYHVEYFIPWTLLLDRDGIPFDKIGTMGFDVTIVDRDPGDTDRKRASWANTGAIGSNWGNMNDAGWITLHGADAAVLIQSIALNTGSVSIDQGTFQMVATILPANATNQNLKWSIVNKPGQTGRANIDETGLVRAIADGEVTVRAEATDGSWVYGEAVITMSNQKPTRWDYNLIKNGLFDQVGAGGSPISWEGWIDGGFGGPTIVNDEGVVVLAPAQVGNYWQYQFNQAGFKAVPNVPYVFSIRAWSNVQREVVMAFSDPSNAHNRYGLSADPTAVNGRSEWIVAITPEPTVYNFNVTFDQIVANTVERVQFMVGHQVGIVYMDSVLLLTVDELAASWPDDTSVPVDLLGELHVYPNPFNNSIMISSGENVQRLTMVNLVGQKVIEMEMSGEKSISTNHLKSGVYFMIFESTNGQRVVHKMIKH